MSRLNFNFFPSALFMPTPHALGSLLVSSEAEVEVHVRELIQ